MKIKFEIEGGTLKTKCINETKEYPNMHVGSLGCRRRCKHFVSLDEENMEVECNFKGEK